LQLRGPGRLQGGDWRQLSLDEVRKSHIRRVLELCLGNRLRAARILGIGRTSLYRYLNGDGHEICAREKSGGAAAWHPPSSKPDATLVRKRFRQATFARSVLFPKGTLSRVRAAIPLAGVRKAREMQSLRQERLASALHLARALTKVKSQSFQPLSGRAGWTNDLESKRFARKSMVRPRSGPVRNGAHLQ